MAILSDYAIGTVSIAANASVVTGTGTAWNIQSFQEGDLLFVDGDVAILSGPPTSATSLPITRPWLGGAKTNVPYRLRYMSDGSRYTNKAQELINLLGDGTLTALATVGSAIDKLSYWAGAGVAALTDLSPFIRTNVLGRVDRSALLATGTGIGVSENLAKSTLIVSDLNNVFIGGWVTGVTGTTANLPPLGGDYVNVFTLPGSDGMVATQFACMWASPYRAWSRSRNEVGVWSSWVIQATSIVGTVAQISGLPSGAIVERGSNANGEYVRFADGTQICWNYAFAHGATTTATGSLFFDAGGLSWTYPIAFIASPSTSPGKSRKDTRFVVATFSDTTFSLWRMYSTISDASTSTMGVTAIGRWF